MTQRRRHSVTFGALTILVGASVVLLVSLLTLANPLSSHAEDAVPPVGIDVIVPVVEVPPAPTAGAIIPVGAAADKAVVEVVVSGLLPYSYFELYLRSTPILVASGFADSTGTFKVTIALPTTLEAGSHSLEVKATDAGGQPYTKTVSQFAVTADRRLAGAGPGSSLLAPTIASGTKANPVENSSTQVTQVDPAVAEEALGTDPVDLGGILNIGGLKTSTQPSFSPQGGTAYLSLTVKNASNTTFDSSVYFWLTSPLGDTITELDHISVAGLAPGETRTIDATMIHISQWPVLFGHATITPPAVVETTELTPLTRDALVLTLPIFATIMAGLFVAGYLLWRYLPVMTKRDKSERERRETLAEAASIVRAEATLLEAETALVEQEALLVEPVEPEPEEQASLVVEPPVVKKPRAPRAAAAQPAVAKPAAAKTPAAKTPAAKTAVAKPAVAKPAVAKPKPKPKPKPKATPKPEPENDEGGVA